MGFLGSSEKLLSVTKQLCCHVNHASRPTVDHGLYINIIFGCCVLGKQENKMCCNSCVHFLKNCVCAYSPWKDEECYRKCSAPDIPEVPTVQGAVWGESGESETPSLISFYQMPIYIFDNHFFDRLDIKHKGPILLHPHPYHWQL